MNTIIFTDADVGCHIDGAFGADHRRTRLIELVNELPAPEGMEYHSRVGLLESLGSPAPDDVWDEITAIDILQDHVAPGLVWLMEAGDLILTTEAQAADSC